MPAPIVGGLTTFINQQLNVEVWDGEIPRTDELGRPIAPTSTATGPSNWPVFRVTIAEPGFARTWTTEDPYDDLGHVLIQVWSTTRQDVETQLTSIEALLAQAANWAQIPLGSSGIYYVIQMLLESWWSGQEEEVRLGQSQLLYRGDLVYLTQIHGAVSTH